MEILEKLNNHEKRIIELEKKLDELTGKPQVVAGPFIFKDKTRSHADLLEELLKSEYCHSKNGLNTDEILEVFINNGRPVVPKKIKNLLAIWKTRNKIEAVKNNGKLSYFWIENES